MHEFRAFVVLDLVSSLPSQDIGWKISEMTYYVSCGTYKSLSYR